MTNILNKQTNLSKTCGHYSLKAILLTSCLSIMSLPVLAQTVETITPTAATTSTEGGTVYDPAYFEQYKALTALGMIFNVPGFQLQSGNHQRGMGQGGANVLINGARLSGKADLRAKLLSIPAKNVVRVEIVDGASLDIPGLSGQVANIISKSSGLNGLLTWTPEFRKGLEPNYLRGILVLSGEKGNLSYSATLRNRANRNGNRGQEFRTLADGTLFETRQEDAQYYADRPGIITALTWTPKEGHIGNVNIEVNKINFNANERSIHQAFNTDITDRGDNNQSLYHDAEDEWNAQINADYEHPFGFGTLKTTGYYRFEASPTLSEFTVYDQTGIAGASRYFSQADEAEAIARSEFSWSKTPGRDWQLSLEGAFNYLDTDAQYFEYDRDTDDYIEFTDLEGVKTRVEEIRGEANLTHTRALSPKWDVQASLGVEYSEISQTGDQQLVRDFIRPKGFITATYKPSDSLNIRTKIEREVGQLNFGDFISSISVSDDLNQAGNANLVPSQKWRAEIEFDKDLGQSSSFKASFYVDDISDLVDRIPIGLDGDGIGNIDKARDYTASFNTTINGKRWGFKGVELEANLSLSHTEVNDPLQGFQRQLNSNQNYYWYIGYRHDIQNTPWAYGLDVDRFKQAPVYRITTKNQYVSPKPFASIYVEHKDIAGMKVKASLRNLLGTRDDFTRIYFDARRDLGQRDITETRFRKYGTIAHLQINKAF